MKKKATKFLKDVKKITLLVKVGGNCSMVFFDSKREKKKALKALLNGGGVAIANYDDIDPSVYDLYKKDGFTSYEHDRKGVTILWN